MWRDDNKLSLADHQCTIAGKPSCFLLCQKSLSSYERRSGTTFSQPVKQLSGFALSSVGYTTFERSNARKKGFEVWQVNNSENYYKDFKVKNVSFVIQIVKRKF